MISGHGDYSKLYNNGQEDFLSMQARLDLRRDIQDHCVKVDPVYYKATFTSRENCAVYRCGNMPEKMYLTSALKGKWILLCSHHVVPKAQSCAQFITDLCLIMTMQYGTDRELWALYETVHTAVVGISIISLEKLIVR